MIKTRTKIYSAIAVTIISVFVLFLYIFVSQDNNSNTTKSTDDNIKQDTEPYLTLDDANKDTNQMSEHCDNYEDIEVFENPIPIVWEAKFDGCLSSCVGASFTRLPLDEQYQYPRFSGYYAENWDSNGEYTGERIIEERFRKENTILRIYGNWIGIDFSYVDTVFNGKCVPDIDIDKIEIIK